MNNKYHKIRNIDLKVCTAEQKIAYNIALRYYTLFINEYKRLPMQFQKSELIHAAIKFMMNEYIRDHSDSKYNIDMIFACLNAGLENYFNSDRKIFSSYEEVGNTFPALYL